MPLSPVMAVRVGVTTLTRCGVHILAYQMACEPAMADITHSFRIRWAYLWPILRAESTLSLGGYQGLLRNCAMSSRLVGLRCSALLDMVAASWCSATALMVGSRWSATNLKACVTLAI